jgi:hypothetical protein
LDENNNNEEGTSHGVSAISKDIPIENIADDGMSDDVIPELEQLQIDLGDCLSHDERTRIIDKKCNTSPLGRALSLIQIIGNHVDPQGECLCAVYTSDFLDCHNLTSHQSSQTLSAKASTAHNT